VRQYRLGLNQQLVSLQDRGQGTTNITEDSLKIFRDSIKQVENEVKNLRQDKRTKESENKERQLSLENSLLDLDPMWKPC